MDKIIIGTEADRLTVAAILVKNKYTVRQGKQRRSGSKSYEYYIEYEPNDDGSKLGAATEKGETAGES